MNEESPRIVNAFDSGGIVEVELRNVRTKYREGKIGRMFLLEFECDQALWDEIGNMRNKLVDFVGALRVIEPDMPLEPEPDEKPAKTPKPLKGEHGKYWQEFFARGLCFSPCLWRTLEMTAPVAENEVRTQLRARMGVGSLTVVSRDDMLRWADASAPTDVRRQELRNLFNSI